MESIAIVIATYNAGKYLDKCLKSIISQINSNVELVIIDGGSTDSTLKIIQNNQNFISYWISESDNGIYDAWNKGIKSINSNWIIFLGADDILLPNAINKYIEFINTHFVKLDIISAKVDYVDERGNHLKYFGEPWNWDKFKRSKLSFAHPGMLHNKRLFEKYGYFDTTFKICGDSEFFLRTQGNIIAGYIDYVTVRMQSGGVSYSFKALLETYKIRKKNSSISDIENIIRFLRVSLFFYLSKIKKIFR